MIKKQCHLWDLQELNCSTNSIHGTHTQKDFVCICFFVFVFFTSPQAMSKHYVQWCLAMRYSLFLSVRKGSVVEGQFLLASELNRRTSWVVDVFRRPSFSHCIDSGELIRSQFPGENPFWIETESWGRKAPDGRAKLGRLTSALLGALSHVFHKLGTLASNERWCRR